MPVVYKPKKAQQPKKPAVPPFFYPVGTKYRYYGKIWEVTKRFAYSGEYDHPILVGLDELFPAIIRRWTLRPNE